MTSLAKWERRARRIIAACPEIGDFLNECDGLEGGRDSFRRSWSGGFGYSGDDADLYVSLPFSVHRDSTPMEESNWEIITRELEAADSYNETSDHPGFITHREGSCLSGWIETAMARRDDVAVLRKAMEFAAALAGYPMLDEDDVSEREWNANHPDEDSCFGDEDCPCDNAEHDRLNREEAGSGCRSWLRGSLIKQQQDKPGWKGMDASDVDIEESVIVCWWCGHCNEWVDALPQDLSSLSRNDIIRNL